MTRIRPLRRMILHFSHIGLTEGRTFTRALGSYLEKDPSPWLWRPLRPPLPPRRAARSAIDALRAHGWILARVCGLRTPRTGPRSQGQRDREIAALSEATAHPGRPSHGLGQLLDDGQPQAGSGLLVSGQLPVQVEALEGAVAVLWGQSGTGVAHRELRSPNPDGDRPTRGRGPQ